ncbi:clavesin-2-like [Musca vetustissima]|uniref:clavesin-2-like n=1 Tax=Musca vetustissima TaxID=27455 RepID=UPI002AB6FCD3|nr:clavesin-2-like [Musca vetustissima]
MLQFIALNEDLQKVANTQLGEKPSRIAEDLLALRTWIETQPHLKARTDDQFLIQFLRGCKYSLEKAKQKLDIFFAMRTQCAELFNVTNVDDMAFRKFHNTGTLLFLPIPLNDNGPRIIFYRCNYAAQDFTLELVTQFVTALHELAMISDPYACVNGISYVLDLSKLTLQHAMLLTPMYLKKIVQFFENTLPMRVNSLTVINLSPAADHLQRIIFSCFPEKIRKRIFICGRNFDDVSSHIPRKYFPLEYGGENGSLAQLVEENNKLWDKYRNYFKGNADYGTNERLRFGKQLKFGDNLGMTGGSFRKLDVD